MNDLEYEIKLLIIESLNLEDLTVHDIKTEEALFNDGLGLDSIDALELGMALKKRYGVKIQVQGENIKEHFYSVKTLVDFISSQAREKPRE
ncbi:MAG: acyl carrier protein [Chlamydiales bacterium]|jgi:acyl carrier protein|nr:acyl carrier protein [Chlamydiales bacterium]